MIKIATWTGGSYENIVRENKLSLYYVDEDYNGIQNDMPFRFCVILTVVGSFIGNLKGMSFAFNITDGSLKFKCFDNIVGERYYPWKTITLT